MSRDGFARGLGCWTPGNIVSDKSGNLVNTATGKPTEAPWQREPTAKVGAGKPPVEESAEGDLDAELDAEDARRTEQLRKLGLDGGAPAEPKRVPGAVNVEARLAEIKALRRSDERRYWSKAIQDEELALIRARDDTEAESAATETEPAGDDSVELADVERELGELKAARKASRTGALSAEQERRELQLIDRKEVLEVGAGDMAPALVELWKLDGGLRANMAKAVDNAARAGSDAFEEIASAVDALPSHLSVAVTDQLRLDWPEVRGSEAHRTEVAAARLDAIIGAVERTHGVRAGQAVEAAVGRLSPAARVGLRKMLAGA